MRYSCKGKSRKSEHYFYPVRVNISLWNEIDCRDRWFLNSLSIRVNSWKRIGFCYQFKIKKQPFFHFIPRECTRASSFGFRKSKMCPLMGDLPLDLLTILSNYHSHGATCEIFIDNSVLTNLKTSPTQPQYTNH